MFKASLFAALSVAVPLTTAGAFAAQKAAQPTYPEAWMLCKAQVDKLPWDAHSPRYTRGASCLNRFGYRI